MSSYSKTKLDKLRALLVNMAACKVYLWWMHTIWLYKYNCIKFRYRSTL